MDPSEDGPRPHDPSRDGETSRRVPNPRRNEPVRENPAPPLGSPMTLPPRGARPAPREDGVVVVQRGVPVWMFGAFALTVVVAAVAGVVAFQRLQAPAPGVVQHATTSTPPPAVSASGAPPEDVAIAIEPYIPPDTLTARIAATPMRSAPSESAEILQRLTPGEPVIITGRVSGVSNGWLVAPLDNGVRGYVAASDLMPLRTWAASRAPPRAAPAARARETPRRQANPPPARPVNPPPARPRSEPHKPVDTI